MKTKLSFVTSKGGYLETQKPEVKVNETEPMAPTGLEWKPSEGNNKPWQFHTVTNETEPLLPIEFCGVQNGRYIRRENSI